MSVPYAGHCRAYHSAVARPTGSALATLMETALPTAAGLAAAILFYVVHRRFYDYRITKNHLEVTWLGISIRKIRLSDIESVSKRRRRWAENWRNTWRPRHRRLVIRRKTGLFKEFVITPAYRYEFRSQLEAAVERQTQARSAKTEKTAPHSNDSWKET